MVIDSFHRLFLVLISGLSHWPNPTKIHHMKYDRGFPETICWPLTPNPPNTEMFVKSDCKVNIEGYMVFLS